jgi:hypothetical protein
MKLNEREREERRGAHGTWDTSCSARFSVLLSGFYFLAALDVGGVLVLLLAFTRSAPDKTRFVFTLLVPFPIGLPDIPTSKERNGHKTQSVERSKRSI